MSIQILLRARFFHFTNKILIPNQTGMLKMHRKKNMSDNPAKCQPKSTENIIKFISTLLHACSFNTSINVIVQIRWKACYVYQFFTENEAQLFSKHRHCTSNSNYLWWLYDQYYHKHVPRALVRIQIFCPVNCDQTLMARCRLEKTEHNLRKSQMLHSDAHVTKPNGGQKSRSTQ